MKQEKTKYALKFEWADYFPDTDRYLRVDKWGDLSFGSQDETGFDPWITDEQLEQLPQRLLDMIEPK